MTRLVFLPRSKSPPIVLITIFKCDRPVCRLAQTLFETLGQGEMVKVWTAINGGVDANNADDNALRMQVPHTRGDWRRRFCGQGISNE